MIRKVLALATALATGALPSLALADSTLTIATVNNVQMIEMQKLAPEFEKLHPDIHLRWVALEENTLRQGVTTDIATQGGQFDILTIGNYEVPSAELLYRNHEGRRPARRVVERLQREPGAVHLGPLRYVD